MNRLFRLTQLVLTAALALLVLTGCQVESQTNRFTSNDGATSSNGSNGSSSPVASETGPEALRSVSLYWSAPSHRINGADIAMEDLGGYEVRYRKLDESDYTRIVIEDPLIEQYHIDALTESDYVFQVAAYDKDGLYSDFVTALR